MCRKFRSCLCASKRHLSVLTVNKVQTEFDVPIYNTEGGDLSSLNNYFVDVPGNGSAICVQEVDTSYYGNDPRSMSVHVGGLHFRTSTAPIQTVKSEGVSLLIPVYNGEKYVESTLQSAIEKPQDALLISGGRRRVYRWNRKDFTTSGLKSGKRASHSRY